MSSGPNDPQVNLEHYHKTHILGSGSFGEVHKYEIKPLFSQGGMPSSVAVKNLDFKLNDNVNVQREISILQVTDHQNVVKLLHVEMTSCLALLVLEFCHKNMKEYTKEHGKYQIDEMRIISYQLLVGLDYLHTQKIIHRDIKDTNVLVKFPGHSNNMAPSDQLPEVMTVIFKWADFGLSRELFSSNDSRSLSIVGNDMFAAPEVARIRQLDSGSSPRGKYDGFKADVFSTGSLLYYLFMGKRPFKKAELEIENKPKRKPAKAIQEVGFQEVLSSMIKWQPKKRLAADDLIDKPFFKTLRPKEDISDKDQENIKSKRERFGIVFSKAFKQKMGRSENHTQIILVGPTGGGKTSSIKHLIGHCKDVADKLVTSDRKSETRSTIEYIFKLKAKDKSDVANGITLGIVDTPGLQDSEGPEQDARNMVCIKNYLDNNFEMVQGKQTLPALVLFVVRGDDNRFDGPHSSFTHCLKQLLCNNLPLTDGTNLIIILTHACNIETNAIKFSETVKRKLKLIHDYVYKLTTFRVPVVLLDNSPPNTIPRVGDWTRLHNGTLQPKNLFDAITRVLEQKKDVMGKLAVREFFARDGKDSKVQFSCTDRYDATISGKKPLAVPESKFYQELKNFQFPDNSPDTSGTIPPESPITPEVQDLFKAVLSQDEIASSQEPKLQEKTLRKHELLRGYDIKGKSFRRINIFESKMFSAEDIALMVEYKIATPYGTAATNNPNIDSFELTISLASLSTKSIQEQWSLQNSLSNSFKSDLLKLNKKYNAKVKFVKDLFINFFNSYGHGLVRYATVGGRVTIHFLKNGHYDERAPIPDSTPTQLYELLHKLGIPASKVPEVRLFYADDLYTPVMDTGNSLQIDFLGGEVETRHSDNLQLWHDTLHKCPEVMVAEKDVLLYHDYVRTLDWLGDKREVIAENLQIAYEDMFLEGRKEVAQQDEKKDVGLIRSISNWMGFGKKK